MLTAPAFRAVLLAKLVEEAQEVQTAAPDEILIELADVPEVVDALLTAQQLSWPQVRQMGQQSRQFSGGFDNRLQLDWVGEPNRR